MLPITVSEIEEMSDLVVTILSGKKSRKLDLKDNLTTSTMDWSSFFTGSLTYFVEIPAECSFTVTYRVSGTHTIFLSQFSRKGNYGCLNRTAIFNLPDGLVLSTNTGVTFSGPEIVFDTASLAKNDALYYLIHPKSIAATDYFSNWFNSRIEPLTEIRPELLPPSLQEIEQTGTREELAAACFRYVQQEIRYISIENGVNAIVPRPAGQVLETKLGDCKDMANLLVSLLRHYKFESWHGISRTSSLKDTFDFPAVAMANHMIGVLKLNDEYVFLDATEDDCFFGDPSFQILGTEVFLLNNKAAYFLPVPLLLRYPAKVRCEYALHTSAEQVIVTVSLTTTGKLNSLFLGLKRDKKTSAKDLTELAEYLFGKGCRIDSVNIGDSLSVLQCSRILPPGSLNVIGAKTYADLSFLPDPTKLSDVFSGYEHPAFSAPYELVLRGIVIPKQPETNKPEQVTVQRSSDGTTLELTFNVGANPGSRSSMTVPADPAPDRLNRYWKSLVAKPILLTP